MVADVIPKSLDRRSYCFHTSLPYLRFKRLIQYPVPVDIPASTPNIYHRVPICQRARAAVKEYNPEKAPMGGLSAAKISLPSVAITATNSLVEVGNRLARSSLVETPSIY
jgi:hypothetical protein